MTQVAVLGSTGSIGTSCLDLIDALADEITVTALSANTNWEQLAEQCRRFHPRWAVLADASLRDSVDNGLFPDETELLFGPESVERIASEEDVDFVLAAIVGAAGLRGTWAAVDAGKTVGIANKETLVVAGPLIMDLARKSGTTLIPVDSEHSAVFQALRAGRKTEVRRIVLTASGGPFRGWPAERLDDVTPEMALKHPTWEMGPKITIDSATLMNKALEVIEAKWLFGLEIGQIEVVVHPQSLVHSFVEFVDGSVIAQLSPPDMKLPIQYALTYPKRIDGPCPRVDWAHTMQMDFSPPDLDAFPALKLGFEVAERGGSCGAVLNAANEAAVSLFLAGNMGFRDIPRACRAVLESHSFDPKPTLPQLHKLDGWARQEIQRWR